MWVHFICSGNTNRSRLAEAYFNSKRISGITTTSSGIYADNNSNGDICEYSLKILEENHILQYTAKSWTKTSREVLQENDLIIFIQLEHFEFVKNKLDYIPVNYEIWDIPDIPSSGFFRTKKVRARQLEADKKIFELIKVKVNELIEKLD